MGKLRGNTTSSALVLTSVLGALLLPNVATAKTAKKWQKLFKAEANKYINQCNSNCKTSAIKNAFHSIADDMKASAADYIDKGGIEGRGDYEVSKAVLAALYDGVLQVEAQIQAYQNVQASTQGKTLRVPSAGAVLTPGVLKKLHLPNGNAIAAGSPVQAVRLYVAKHFDYMAKLHVGGSELGPKAAGATYTGPTIQGMYQGCRLPDLSVPTKETCTDPSFVYARCGIADYNNKIFGNGQPDKIVAGKVTNARAACKGKKLDGINEVVVATLGGFYIHYHNELARQIQESITSQGKIPSTDAFDVADTTCRQDYNQILTHRFIAEEGYKRLKKAKQDIACNNLDTGTAGSQQNKACILASKTFKAEVQEPLKYAYCVYKRVGRNFIENLRESVTSRLEPYMIQDQKRKEVLACGQTGHKNDQNDDSSHKKRQKKAPVGASSSILALLFGAATMTRRRRKFIGGALMMTFLSANLVMTGCSKKDSAKAFCGSKFTFTSKTRYDKKKKKWRNSSRWRSRDWQPHYTIKEGVDLGQATELYMTLDFNGGSGSNTQTLSSSSGGGSFGGTSTSNKQGLDAANDVFEKFKQVLVAHDALKLEVGNPDKAGAIGVCAVACVNPMLVAIQGAKLIGDKLKAVKENMAALKAKKGTEEEEEAKAQFALLNQEKDRYEWKLIQIQSAMRDAYTSCQAKSFSAVTNVKGSGKRQASALALENFKAGAQETCTCDVGIDWEAMTGDDNPFDADDKAAAEVEGLVDPPGWAEEE